MGKICRQYCQSCAFAAGFLLLINISMYEHMNRNKVTHDDLFRQDSTREEHEMFTLLIRTFDKLARNVNLTYFISDGSLIGSVRHHGMIPWDDDIDLGVLSSQQDKLRKLFTLLPSNMQGYTHSLRWKIGYKGRQRLVFRPDLPWGHPFLDIVFHEVDNGSIWDEHYIHYGLPKLKLKVIFPLIKRPFMGFSLPAPHQPQVYIRRVFGAGVMKNCASSGFSHRQELPLYPYFKRTIRCEALKQSHPFVHRTIIHRAEPSLVNETLMLNGTVIHSIITLY